MGSAGHFSKLSPVRLFALAQCALLCALLCVPGVAEAGAGKSPKHAPKVSKANNMQPLPAFELGKYQYCGSDRDCVLAQNGCCDCANGGQDLAINKERTSAFQMRFNCLHVNCGEKIGDPVCASGVISCINHKCRYFADAPKAKPKPKIVKKKKKEDDDDE